MMRFACIKQMEIIGEASNHLSTELKSKFLEIERAQIAGMRNVFAHEYFWARFQFSMGDYKK